jgi:hypothetical protein
MRLEIPREFQKAATAAPAAVSGPPTLQAAARLPTPVSPRPSASGSAPAIAPLEIVLPLARYARLCAELALFPHEAEAIFRRYGLERVEERTTVDAAWKERFRHDPRQYGVWEVMYRRYIGWLKRRTPAAR